MRQHSTENARENARTQRRPSKQHLQPDTIEHLSPPSVIAGSRTNRSATGKRERAPVGTSPSQSEEHLQVCPRKKRRLRLQQPRKWAGSKRGNLKKQVETAGPKRAGSKKPSPRPFQRPVSYSRSVTLSAEPPPVKKSTVASPTDEKSFSDPYFEAKTRAREDFGQTGNYKVFQELLAPFRKSGKTRDPSDWVYDEEAERWWCKDESTGQKIWAPTSGSFL
ncbi:hypothetical protein B0T14DRAFT_525110 [Immersiella caudata]|uniref:Uncharacterized protein n=1 Tax=Immersiella caudata TaxID=314043 RepID=A0AA39WL40_9PEZI|nr:hypothetical protein B0T14DRAFT_525110 [Immersiella caudata]